jgi:hypothetical protein
MEMTGLTFPVFSANASANENKFVSGNKSDSSEPEPRKKFKLDDYEEIR